MTRHTHDLAVAGDTLHKRYTSWQRGEHRREWTMLNHLHAYTADLVPVPLAAELEVEPPTITMSVLPGTPMAGTLSAAQLDGLEQALRRMWSVPVGTMPPRRCAPGEALAAAREGFAAAPRPLGTPGRAYDVAVDFLSRLTFTDPDLAETPKPVLGHSDPNLANYLWDGSRVRIVDFEDAGRSDVAYELATLVEHLSARETDWDEFCARFEVSAERLLAYRRLAASLWLHMLLPGRPAAARNPPAALDRQAERLLGLRS